MADLSNMPSCRLAGDDSRMPGRMNLAQGILTTAQAGETTTSGANASSMLGVNLGESGEVEGFNVIVFGSIGDGKSMLVNTLTGGAEPGMCAGGCTKTVNHYALKESFAQILSIDKGFLWDTPGVGDVHASIGQVVGTVQDIVSRGVQFHAVLVTVKADSRVKPDSRLISHIINSAFVHNKQQIIVVMTQCDRLKRRERKNAYKNLHAEVQKMFDTVNEPAEKQIKIVQTYIPNFDDMESDDEDFDEQKINHPNLLDSEFNITQLIKELQTLSSNYYSCETQPMKWGDPDMKGAIDAHVRLLHKDLAASELQNKVDEMTAQIEKATQKTLESMKEQRAKLQKEFDLQREQMQREREAERKANQQMLADKKRQMEAQVEAARQEAMKEIEEAKRRSEALMEETMRRSEEAQEEAMRQAEEIRAREIARVQTQNEEIRKAEIARMQRVAEEKRLKLQQEAKAERARLLKEADDKRKAEIASVERAERQRKAKLLAEFQLEEEKQQKLAKAALDKALEEKEAEKAAEIEKAHREGYNKRMNECIIC